MSQLDLTTAIAVVGAVTGVLALTLEFASFLRDRSRLRVSVTKGVIVTPSSTSEPMVWVEAVNVGRRPVQVVGAGLMAEGSPKERLGMFGDLKTLPKTLNEGDVVKVSAFVEAVAEATVASGKGLPKTGYVTDSAGQQHTTRVPDDVRRLVAEAANVIARRG